MSKTNILVVEDEIVVAQSIRAVLENRGYAVGSIVTSGEAAVETVKRDHPDLILMDIFLNGEMDGITAAGIIRTHYRTPIVFLTAYSEKHLIERAKASDPFGYLIKPFRDEELLSTLAITLHRAGVEEELRRSKNLYRSFMDRSPIPIFIQRQGRFVYLNGAAVELHHAEREEELIDRKVIDFVHPDYRREVRARLDGCPETGWKKTTDLKLVRPSAEPVDIEASSIPVEFKGKCSQLVFCVDVTRRKLAETALGECRGRFQALADAAPAAILILGEEGILFANPALERITGRSMTDLSVMTVSDLFPADECKPLLTTVRKLLRGKGSCVRRTIGIVNRNGERLGLHCALIPIRHEKKPAVLLVGCEPAEAGKVERQLKCARLLCGDEAVARTQRDKSGDESELQRFGIMLQEVLKQGDRSAGEIERTLLAQVRNILRLELGAGVNRPPADRLGRATHFLEKHLSDAMSAVAGRLAVWCETLSPVELMVASLVDDNMSTRKIAELIGLKEPSVKEATKIIREKLGLKDKKVTLRSYLRSLH